MPLLFSCIPPRSVGTPDTFESNAQEYQALAQDQKVAFEQLIAACAGLEDLQVHTYDGDTPQDRRAGKFELLTTIGVELIPCPEIRDTASVIFTNFVGWSYLLGDRQLT